MPYTQRQIRCLAGMGVVPWVIRNGARSDNAAYALAEAVAVAEEHASSPTPAIPNVPARVAVNTTQIPVEVSENTSAQIMQTPLVEIPFRGQRCTQLGKSDAPLLILVESVSTQQKQYPFESADAKIFEDMLRAIAWRRQDVCLAVLPPAAEPSLFQESQGPTVSDVCKPHRDAVLLFRQQVPDSPHADDLTVPLERPGMLAWQLPHPALLRESPARKRQAWNVLKAARARLG